MRRPRWRLPEARTSSKPTTNAAALGDLLIALVFRYEVRDSAAFEEAYGQNGEWAAFFKQGPGYIGTELLRDVEEAERYLVIDRWESAEAYNAFLAAHQEEYLRRADEARFHYLQELRFGTFENVWGSDQDDD